MTANQPVSVIRTDKVESKSGWSASAPVADIVDSDLDASVQDKPRSIGGIGLATTKKAAYPSLTSNWGLNMIKTAAIAVAFALAIPASLSAQQSPAPDYSVPESWLCRPDRIDACATDQSVTVVEADGSMSVEPLVPDTDRPFDCFYVYPTVSRDLTGNSDMVAGQEELRVAHVQAARFRQHCRVFAPLYRQMTLTALRSSRAGEPFAGDRALAYSDVERAWQSYLANDNDGRGVVLVGHSQGSGMIRRLLNEMTDPAERSLIISAMPIGSTISRSDSDPAEGDFPWMPICTSADESGCLVAYSSFRDTVPPPANSRYGRAGRAGEHVVCVNPAALLGDGGIANSIFSTSSTWSSSQEIEAWVAGKPIPTTQFVSVPGLISTRCVSRGDFTYLEVSVNADADDPRTDDIAGDVVRDGSRVDSWGLHLVDMAVVMGDLVALTERQYLAWKAARD